MKRIVFHATSFKSFWAHYSLFKDVQFAAMLRELGYEIALSENTELLSTDHVLFIEVKSLHNIPAVWPYLDFVSGLKYLFKYLIFSIRSGKPVNYDLYQQCKKKGMLDKTMLMILEGTLDAPENHSPVLSQLCKYVFTWNDNLVNNQEIIKMNWPEPVDWPIVKTLPFNEKKLLSNISANKFSSRPGELYSARRRSILYFENRFGDQFDLYGIGWNEPATFPQRRLGVPVTKFASYKGKVDSKADTFAQYRFALIYENVMVPGWVTEKIFDCLRSNCVPVYLGAPNIQSLVPSEVYIDRRNFDTDKKLGDFLEQMGEEIYNGYLQKIAAYLKGPSFRNQLSIALAEKIAETIER